MRIENSFRSNIRRKKSNCNKPKVDMLMNKKFSLWDYFRGALYFSMYGVVKYLPAPIGDPFRWMVLKIFMDRLESMRIKDGATFWFPYNIRIGKNVSINEWVFIDGIGGVDIGDDCRIAHGTSILSEDHVFEDPDVLIRLQGRKVAPVHIGRDCWLGAGVRITRGVTIGEGSVIGAGSVVTKDIPPYSIAVGVPAKVIGSRKKHC